LALSIAVSLSLRLIAAVLVAALPVRVTTNSGEEVEGSWTAIAEGGIVVERSGETLSLAGDDLATLSPQSSAEGSGPAIRATLRDESRIAAESATLREDTLEIQPRNQPALRLPLDDVAAIRFRPASPTTDPQWLGMMDEEGRGDLLAVRRDGGQLDSVRGLVESIGEEKVTFQLGGESVEAPLARLEGIVFAGPDREPGGPAVRVTDIYGSRWNGRGLVPGPVDASVGVQLSGETTHRIPLDQITEIAWSGSIVRLAERTPAEQRYRPFLAPEVDRSLIEGWFLPRVADGDDLVMVAGSSVSYRVAPGFRTFEGSVRRDPSVAARGAVTVRVSVGGDVAWAETLKDDRPRGFELALDDAARVRIEILAGEDGDVGDTVRIGQPSLLK